MKTNKSRDIDPILQEAIRKIRLVAFDFDGVFTDNMVYVLQDGSEAVRCNRSDGIGLQKLKRMGIQNCEDKRQTLTNVAQEFGISLDEIAFVGNDINDLSCLTSVGFPIVVYDAHLEVIPLAAYRTEAGGGQGAVREICDLFEQVLTK